MMFLIMIPSGLLSSMYLWVDKLDDVRVSLNDLYMTLLMSGWMLLFMAIIHMNLNVFLIGLLLVIINIWCIRTQFMISESQYKIGMIPHHSMAIHMSKKLLTKDTNINIKPLLNQIIDTQTKEIILFTARSILNDTILFFINFRFTMKSRFHFIIFLFRLFQRTIKII